MGAAWAQLTGVIGLAVVLAQILKHQVARARMRRAAADLRALGEELGLAYFPPTYASGQGTLRGVYRGRRVNIDPDEARAIIVRFESSPRVVLATYSVNAPAAHDMVIMSAADEGFEAFWRTRRAAPELASSLSESARSDWLDGFRGPIARNIGSVSVSSESVTVVVDYGSPCFIPSHAIRLLLPACANLAQRIEPRPSDTAALEPMEPALPARPDATPAFTSMLVALAVVALVGKLGLAWWTDGAGDARTLQQLAAWAHYVGRGVYLAQPGFGLPPSMVPVLAVLDRLADATGLDVGFWTRVLASWAEAGILLLSYLWLRPRLGEPAARVSLLLIATLPAALVLTGSWGDWNAVMVLFVLLSIYWTERRRDWLAGGALGFALCVTLAPMYAAPVLLFARRTLRARLAFGAGTLLVLAAFWLPWFPAEPAEALRRLIYREGTYGQWGLSWLLTHSLGPKDILHSAYASAGPYLPFAVALVLAQRATRLPEPPPLLAQVGVVACISLVSLPIFELRDLRVVVPILACTAPLASAFFALSSVALVVAVYAYWAGAGPWSVLGAIPEHGFRGHADYFQVVCLCSLLVLAWSAWTQLREAPEVAARQPLTPPGGWLGWVGAAALLILLPATFQVSAEGAAGARVEPEPLADVRALDYVNLSSWLLVRQMNHSGIEVARKATLLLPTSAAAWNNLAAGHANERRWDDAIAAAERAVALAPSFQLARNNLAWARDRKREAMQLRAWAPTPQG